MKKQQGFSLIGMLLAMTVFAISIAVYIPYKQKLKEQYDAVVFMQQTKHLIEQIQFFNYKKSTTEDNFNRDDWPSSLNALMTDYPGTFWPVCSESAAQQGQCRRPESTPWNKPITYNIEHVGLNIYNAFLTIPISQTGDKKAVWAKPFYDLSGVTKQPNGDLKIEIKPLLNSIAYDAFLKKDGSTPLTDDWDVGNKNILNVKDITLLNADGTMTSVAAGLTRSRFTARHNAVIKHPSCPAGFRPQVQLAVQGNIPQSSINDFKEFGPIQIDGYDVTGGWKITTKYVATRKSDGKKYELTDGVVAGETYCSK
jgi:type II secretory pathway pseudopilin PulG